MASDELLIKISAYADGELAGEEAAGVFAVLESDPELGQDIERFRKLDLEASRLPVPEMDKSVGEAVWGWIAERSVKRSESGDVLKPEGAEKLKELAGALPAVPEISEERWDTVWSGVKQLTGQMAKSVVSEASTSELQPVSADLTPVDMKIVSQAKEAGEVSEGKVLFMWPAIALVATAAAIMMVAYLGLFSGQGLPRSSDPEVANHRISQWPHAGGSEWIEMVAHVEGLDEPVDCFVEVSKDDGS